MRIVAGIDANNEGIALESWPNLIVRQSVADVVQ